MANKKINELDSRATLTLSDLMAVGDPSTGYLYKTTISDLKTLTGAGVVSFNGRIGSVVPAEGDYTLTQLSDVIITSASNNQVLRYNGSNWVNATIDLSGYVPYTGATGNVNLGSNTLLAAQIKATSSAGLSINANSGTQIADLGAGGGANMTLFGGLTGTSASFSSSVTGNTIVKTGGTSSQFLKADGSVDSSTYLTTSSAASTYVPLTRTLTINGTAYDLTADRTWTIPTHDAVTIGTANGLSLSGQVLSLALASTSATGALSSTDWNTFNGKQATITLTTTGSSGSSTLVGATLNIPTYTLAGLGGQPALNGTGFVKISGTTISYDNSTYLTTSSAASTYLPLAGGTLTGALNGTSAVFSSTVQASAYRLTGMTAGSGALYWTSDRVTLANYNATGKVHIEANGGTGVATFGGATYNSDFVGTGRFTGDLYAETGIFSLGLFTSDETKCVVPGGVSSLLTLNLAGVLTGTSATFSGAVTTAGYFIVPAAATSGGVSGFLNQYNAGNASSRSWRTTNDLVVYGDFAIQQSTTQTGSTYANQLYFNATGAATFSSSVTATTGLTVGSLGSGSDAVITLATNASGAPRTIYYKASNATINFTGTGGTDLMTLSNGGALLISQTTDNGDGKLQITTTGGNAIKVRQSSAGGYGLEILAANNVGTYYFQNFTAGTTGTGGSITSNGVLVAFNTTSDYRLKQDFKDYNGLDLVSRINTYDYEWKFDKSRMYGVMAHELQEVLPYAVLGEKDAEQMQQVDYSKIVPILVKAIQELKAEIENLKNI